MAEEHTSPSEEPGQAAIARGIHMIPLPAKLIVRGNLASNWKKFRRMWNNYEIATRLRQESKELRTAMLLTCIGVEAILYAIELSLEFERIAFERSYFKQEI